MRLVALLLVIAARAAHADCVDRDTALAKVAAATAANEARFAEALKRATLQPARLDASQADEHRANAGKVVTRAGASVLVLDGVVLSCGGEAAPEFASDGKQVFQVERRETRGKVTRVSVCACDGRPTGCGAVPRQIATGFVIPKGQTYGGVKRIDYVADLVLVTYGAGQTQPCPPPPQRK